MDKEQVLVWQRGFEMAREAEREMTCGEPVDTERSVRTALELMEFCRRSGHWPRSEDDRVWGRDVEIVRELWNLLKRRLR